MSKHYNDPNFPANFNRIMSAVNGNGQLGSRQNPWILEGHADPCPACKREKNKPVAMAEESRSDAVARAVRSFPAVPDSRMGWRSGVRYS